MFIVKFRIKFFVVALGCCLVCCDKSKEVSYTPPVFESESDVFFEMLNDSVLLQSVRYMAVYDSLLIVCDPSLANAISIFSKNDGTFLKSTGLVGKGPGELVNPKTFSLNYKTGDLYVFDAGKMAIIRFNIDEILTENRLNGDDMRMPGIQSSMNNSYFLKDSLFIANDPRQGIVVSTMNEDSCRSSIALKVPNGILPDEWIHFNAIWTTSTVKPDGAHYAQGTILGGILDIYSIDDERVGLSSEKYFYEPIYDRKGSVITFNDNTIFGFCTMYGTDDYLYATAHGKANPTELPRQIWQFDWAGNPIKSHNSNYNVYYFTVDEYSKQIYASVYKDGELVIVKGAISD